MEQSPELKQVMISVYDAVSRGDVGYLERILSEDKDLIFIGTDPNEWFDDGTSVRAMLRAQAEAGVTVLAGDVRAFQEGPVGWIADQGRFKLPDGSEVPFRITAVFHREHGDWRMIQEHCSLGVSNEEAIGQELAV